jgi:hypothetical protein
VQKIEQGAAQSFAHQYTMLEDLVVSSKTGGCGFFLYNFIPISKAQDFFFFNFSSPVQ